MKRVTRRERGREEKDKWRFGRDREKDTLGRGRERDRVRGKG